MSFVQVYTSEDADLIIRWETGNHGDSYAFDGNGGVLAHAFFPPPLGGVFAGHLHFDDDENWTIGNTGIDLETVALHEIGHLLGIRHSEYSWATMYPYYTGISRTLSSDDILAIGDLYGMPQSITGASAICESVVYGIAKLHSCMNVIWSLNDSYYSSTPFYFKTDYPSTNQCLIRRNNNHPLNGVLTANIYIDGELVNTVTRSVWTIPEFTCTIAATGAPSSYTFPAYLTSGMRVNVPCNSIVTLTSSDFTHMSITKTGNASNYFEVDGSQIHFTIPTTNLGQSITVNGQSQTDCQSFSLTFLASTTPGYWKPKDLDPLDPIDFDSLDLNVYPIGDGLLQIEVVEISSDEKGISVMQMNKEANSYNCLLEIYKVSNGSKVYSHEIGCVSYQLNTLGWEPGTYVIRAIVRRKEQKSKGNIAITNVLTSKIKI